MPPEAEEKEKEGGEAGDSPSAVATLSTIATTMTALIGDLRTLLRKRWVPVPCSQHGCVTSPYPPRSHSSIHKTSYAGSPPSPSDCSFFVHL